MKKAGKYILALALLLLLCGCGGAPSDGLSSGDGVDLGLTESYTSKYVTSWHNIFNSSNYSGSLAVMFRGETGMRLREGKFVKDPMNPERGPVGSRPSAGVAGREVLSLKEDAQAFGLPSSKDRPPPPLSGFADLNDLVARHGGTVERGMGIDEAVMGRALTKARREGRRLHDWNLFYLIRVADAGHAEELFYELSKTGLVEWAHPLPVGHLAGTVERVSADIDEAVIASDGQERGNPVQGKGLQYTSELSFKDNGSPTQDLTALQTYLQGESATGGLNILPAWDAGITGQGVRILDSENNWNFGHEDLPISELDVLYPDVAIDNSDNAIQHGTAVIGLLGGLDNGLGVTGITHSSEIKLDQKSKSAFGALTIIEDFFQDYSDGYVDGDDAFIRPGDILNFLGGVLGPSSPLNSKCAITVGAEIPNYCVPIESYPLGFAILQDLSSFGVIIMEPAGEGATDLASPLMNFTDCGGDPCPNLGKDDSGAIMVASSQAGKDHTRPWWSNCGTRVNTYAWGDGIVTAGYGQDGFLSGQFTPNPYSDPSDQNKWYTSSFFGPCGSTTLVSGAVALVQSYTKEFYKDIIPHKQVYLDSYQMRKLIDMSGTPSSSGCNIGKKPDVGAMMALVADGAVLPHVAPDTASLFAPPNAVSGIRYDMDKDGRADLISLDPTMGSGGGVWKIDLSSVAPPGGSEDNFGAWDLMIEMTLPGGYGQGEKPIFFPVVHDYDSDGDADLALYDSNSGKWYIKYTTEELLAFAAPVVKQTEWDVVIDYSADENWKRTSEPRPADYNGDNWLDIGIVTPDGHWLIDFGGVGHIEKQGNGIVYETDFGGIEKDIPYLSTEQLAEAPGWAWLSVAGIDLKSTEEDDIIYKVPDGIDESGYLYILAAPIFDIDAIHNFDYGDNKVTMTGIDFDQSLNMTKSLYILLFNYPEDGDWSLTGGSSTKVYAIPQPTWEYDKLCQIVPADYNGDGMDDFAVKCPDLWKITYYDGLDEDPFIKLESERIINLVDNLISLPPTIHPGGIKYQDLKATLEYYNVWDQYQDTNPIGPHTIQCLDYWATHPTKCLNSAN